MTPFFGELKRRNVWRATIAYLAASWVLIQVADIVLPRFGFSDTAITNVIILLAIGLVPATIISWFFEWTPDGFVRDAQLAAEASATPRTRKGLDRLIVVLLVIAVGFFAVDKFVLDPARDTLKIEAATEKGRSDALLRSYGDKSIAVLAFQDMSPERDQEYFADGIAEELLNVLAAIRELRVISRSTAFSFKGSTATLLEIGEKLNVSYILEGSVRKAGGRLRITAQLIDARTDAHVWSETYDRTLDDVFAIQDEISANIVEQLKITLLADAKGATKIDSTAYDLYLKAQFIVHTENFDQLRDAQALLDQVLEIEPNYIPALTTLARVYYRIPKTEGLSRELNQAEIQKLADRIVAIDPNGADALGWQGWFAYLQGDLQRAAKFYEAALRVDPNNFTLLRVLVLFLIDIGHSDAAIILGNHLQLRDPNCAICSANLARAYASAGRYAEAAQVAIDSLAWRPAYPGIYWTIGRSWLLAGQAEKALAAIEQESSDDGTREIGTIMALHDLGRITEFETRFANFRDNVAHAEAIARIYAWTGDVDQAFAWLDKSVEEEGPSVVSRINTPFYAKIRQDPRWRDLRERHGFVDLQGETIDFDYSLLPH